MTDDDQLLDAVIRKQVSIFTISDERLRKLFIILLRRIRNR
jgi:hypothetical protein